MQLQVLNPLSDLTQVSNPLTQYSHILNHTPSQIHNSLLIPNQMHYQIQLPNNVITPMSYTIMPTSFPQVFLEFSHTQLMNEIICEDQEQISEEFTVSKFDSLVALSSVEYESILCTHVSNQIEKLQNKNSLVDG